MSKLSFFAYLDGGEKTVREPISNEKVILDELIPNSEGEMGDKGNANDNPIGDDSPSVLSLRNLYRQNRIDKTQYVGGLATLLATGLITKAQFTRLKAGA